VRTRRRVRGLVWLVQLVCVWPSLCAMPDRKSRARVERLLRGEFCSDDLTNLFLYARNRCDGRESVAEIGHFVAHPDERDRGIVTRATQEWFITARYHFSKYNLPLNSPKNVLKLPPVAQDFFRIAVSRIDPKSFRKITDKTGWPRQEADRFMSKLAGRLTRNPDGTWALPKKLADKELLLYTWLTRVIVSKPAFEADRLCDDFLATLKSNSPISKDEIRTHGDTLRTLVQLYAVTVMHNCPVQVGDGTNVQLIAGHDKGNKIHVSAPIPVDKPQFMISPMFLTNLDSASHCHPTLLTMNFWGDFEIELGRDQRLTPL
jgi:hypothetical protein